MKNQVDSGRLLTLTAPYTVASGAGALVGKIFGVATAAITSATAGVFDTMGRFDLAKDTSTFADGVPVYWDNTNKVCTSTANSNWLIGHAARLNDDGTSALGGSSGDATVRVRLSGTAKAVFKSSEQTGTGSAQSIAHGLGVTPTRIAVYPSDTSPSTAGVYTLTEGTNTSTNVVVTVTSGKKFFVIAWAE
jgi:predicted RecA/RadA family phage recombinase